MTIGEVRAYELAKEFHRGQNDKRNVPYIQHCEGVARNLGGDPSEIEIVVAFLHDVVEDTDATLPLLETLGADEAQIAAIDAMTRREGETYRDYIYRCIDNPIAKVVKVADLKHNLDPARELPGSEGVGIRKRHTRALAFIEGGYDVL